MFQSYANFSRNRFNQPLHQWERRTLKEALEHNPLFTYRSLSTPRFRRWYPLVNQTTCHRVMRIFLGTGSVSHCIGGREGGTRAKRSLHIRIPPIPRFQRWYPLVNQTTQPRAMLIFQGPGSISHCIGWRQGGTGAQSFLHVRIPLDPTIPAVLSACQSGHASRSYANVYRMSQNQPLHRRERRRHQSTTFFTPTDSPLSHEFSGAICLSIGPRIAELC